MVAIIAFWYLKDSGTAYNLKEEALKNMNYILIDKKLFYPRYEDVIKDDADEDGLNMQRKIYEVSADAEGWKFIKQEMCSFAETKNSKIPFVATIATIFQNPNNKNIYHLHTKTWVYHSELGDWKPLAEDVFEYDDSHQSQNKFLNSGSIWDGDYIDKPTPGFIPD